MHANFYTNCIINYPCGSKFKMINVNIIIYQFVDIYMTQIMDKMQQISDTQEKILKRETITFSCSTYKVI